MRRKNKRRDWYSVSLFPFLAVLICTFGVLIVLLVLVVKAADHQANASKQQAGDRNAAEQEELRAEVALQEIRIEGLTKVRPRLLDQLHEARQQRAYLQSTIDSLAGDAERLDAQVRLVANQAELPDLAQTTDDIRRLQHQLEADLAELRNRRQSASAYQPTRYSIVPHDGPDGTSRRPIYIECLDDRLIIQPYEIELTTEDFVQPIVANNPLDAALVAVREYFLENNLNEVGQTPYPLLVVRPQGAELYSIARHAIRSWDEEFGYELIEAEKQLDFGQPDAQLNDKMRQAIEAAKRRQRAYIAQQILHADPMHGQLGTGTRSDGVALEASPQQGGFVKADGNGPTHGPRSDRSERETRQISPNGSDVQNQAAEFSASAAANGQPTSNSIAETRGNNWALPETKHRAIGYRRPVIILLNHHEMLINPNGPAAKQKRIAFDRTLESSLENLVTEVWQQVDSWGVAGVNSYWKPELVFRVRPGGVRRFEQIVELMQGSGLEIREDHE